MHFELRSCEFDCCVLQT